MVFGQGDRRYGAPGAAHGSPGHRDGPGTHSGWHPGRDTVTGSSGRDRHRDGDTPLLGTGTVGAGRRVGPTRSASGGHGGGTSASSSPGTAGGHGMAGGGSSGSGTPGLPRSAAGHGGNTTTMTAWGERVPSRSFEVPRISTGTAASDGAGADGASRGTGTASDHQVQVGSGAGRSAASCVGRVLGRAWRSVAACWQCASGPRTPLERALRDDRYVTVHLQVQSLLQV